MVVADDCMCWTSSVVSRQQHGGLGAFAEDKAGSIDQRKVLVRTNGSYFRIGVRTSLTRTVRTNLGYELPSTSHHPEKKTGNRLEFMSSSTSALLKLPA